MARLCGYLSFGDARAGEALLAAMAASFGWSNAGRASARLQAGAAEVGLLLVERGADNASLAQRFVRTSGSLSVFDGGAGSAEDGARLEAVWARDPLRFLASLEQDVAGARFEAQRSSLTFFRDRFGARALYWLRDGSLTLFAAEPKALLACPGISPRLNLQALGRYLSMNYRMWFGRRETFFEGIEELPLAGFACATREGVELGRYWAPPDAVLPHVADERAYVEEYGAHLERTVRSALERSRRRVFFVSGGLDAPVIAAKAAQLTGERVDCCAAVFPGESAFDESALVRALTDRIGATTHLFEAEPESFLKAFDQILERHDQPLISPTYVLTHQLLERLNHAGYDSVFGGGGGDIVSQGCLEYQLYLLADYRSQGADPFAREVDAWCRRVGPLLRYWPGEPGAVRSWIERLTDPRTPGRIFNNPDWIRVDRSLLGAAFDGVEITPPEVGVRYHTYRQSRVAEDLFHQAIAGHFVEDVNGASFGHRAFDPFWDQRFVEFGFGLPVQLLLHDGWTKYVVRRASREFLPAELRERPDKTGLGVPVSSWLRRAPLAGALERVLESPIFLRSGLFQPEPILDAAEAHLAGDADRGGLLWNVFAFCRWAERWLPGYD